MKKLFCIVVMGLLVSACGSDSEQAANTPTPVVSESTPEPATNVDQVVEDVEEAVKAEIEEVKEEVVAKGEQIIEAEKEKLESAIEEEAEKAGLGGMLNDKL